MGTSQMLVVSALDEGFVPHFAAMLDSAWYHNPNARFRLLDCGIAAGTRARLVAFARGMDFDIVDVDMRRLDGLHTDDRHSTAAFGRLLIPELFPDEPKALYLDADVVVLGDLGELWTIDIDRALFAGVTDSPHEILPVFVNSGVLMMNLNEWRRRDFTAKCIDFGRTNRTKDQTTINTVGQDAIVTIEPRWNFLLHRHLGPPETVPCVVHYTAHRKPWRHRDTQLAEIYRYHRNRTPWPLTERLPPYRSAWLVAIYLLLMRRKYWRHVLEAPRYRRLATEHLAGLPA